MTHVIYTRDKFLELKFVKIDIKNQNKLSELFKLHNFDIVINLAAQAGVRYSIENPKKYIDTNIIGFFNICLSIIFEILSDYHLSSLKKSSNRDFSSADKFNLSKRSFLLEAVKPSICFFRHVEIAAWSPDKSSLGTSPNFIFSGLVY